MNTKRKPEPLAGGTRAVTSDTLQANNSTAIQRKAIYQHLAAGNTLTTLFARESLGIMHPAARVMELRKRGFNIVTHQRHEEDVTGKDHRVAEYVLFHGSEANHE